MVRLLEGPEIDKVPGLAVLDGPRSSVCYGEITWFWAIYSGLMGFYSDSMGY